MILIICIADLSDYYCEGTNLWRVLLKEHSFRLLLSYRWKTWCFTFRKVEDNTAQSSSCTLWCWGEINHYNPTVKQWLVMLQDAVFEVDNLFDEINTEALRCKVETEYEGQTLSGKVHNILSRTCKCRKVMCTSYKG